MELLQCQVLKGRTTLRTFLSLNYNESQMIDWLTWTCIAILTFNSRKLGWSWTFDPRMSSTMSYPATVTGMVLSCLPSCHLSSNSLSSLCCKLISRVHWTDACAAAAGDSPPTNPYIWNTRDTKQYKILHQLLWWNIIDHVLG